MVLKLHTSRRHKPTLFRAGTKRNRVQRRSVRRGWRLAIDCCILDWDIMASSTKQAGTYTSSCALHFCAAVVLKRPPATGRKHRMTFESQISFLWAWPCSPGEDTKATQDQQHRHTVQHKVEDGPPRHLGKYHSAAQGARNDQCTLRGGGPWVGTSERRWFTLG